MFQSAQVFLRLFHKKLYVCDSSGFVVFACWPHSPWVSSVCQAPFCEYNGPKSVYLFFFFVQTCQNARRPGRKHCCKCSRGLPQRVVCLHCVWAHVRQVEVSWTPWEKLSAFSMFATKRQRDRNVRWQLLENRASFEYQWWKTRLYSQKAHSWSIFWPELVADYERCELSGYNKRFSISNFSYLILTPRINLEIRTSACRNSTGC